VPDPARWPVDAERPLTDAGRDTQRRVSESLRRAGFGLDVLFTSPLLRARQTAEIVGDVFGLKETARVCDALAQPPDLDLVAKCVGDVGDDSAIGLTGHSPWMDETASLLLTGTRDGMSVDFRKSGAMVIGAEAIAPGSGQLIAFLTPELAAT
jgi:phosphohistidine phosphatase SixA